MTNSTLTLPDLFNTDMSVEVEYVSHRETEGIFITARIVDECDTVTYGPLSPMSEHDALSFQIEEWGSEVGFQDGEVFESITASGVPIIYVKAADGFYTAPEK
jgi:hypothetical protein